MSCGWVGVLTIYTGKLAGKVARSNNSNGVYDMIMLLIQGQLRSGQVKSGQVESAILQIWNSSVALLSPNCFYFFFKPASRHKPLIYHGMKLKRHV